MASRVVAASQKGAARSPPPAAFPLREARSNSAGPRGADFGVRPDGDIAFLPSGPSWKASLENAACCWMRTRWRSSIAGFPNVERTRTTCLSTSSSPNRGSSRSASGATEADGEGASCRRRERRPGSSPRPSPPIGSPRRRGERHSPRRLEPLGKARVGASRSKAELAHPRRGAARLTSGPAWPRSERPPAPLRRERFPAPPRADDSLPRVRAPGLPAVAP